MSLAIKRILSLENCKVTEASISEKETIGISLFHIVCIDQVRWMCRPISAFLVSICILPTCFLNNWPYLNFTVLVKTRNVFH